MQPATAKREKTYIPAFDAKPEFGAWLDVMPRFSWLRTGLPFELNHINLWLLESDTGYSIIDTGFNVQDTRQAWEKVFTDKFAKKPVENIFITHFHPDHFGLAGWLAEKTGVTPHMTAGELAMVRHLTGDDAQRELETTYRDFFLEAGVADTDTLIELLTKRMMYKKVVYKAPTDINIVKGGDTVTLGGKPWQVVIGSGHSPEHACLYNAADKLFIAGDIVLPDITPNISFFPGNVPEHDPVDDYLKTLDHVTAQIPDDVTVFPSHGIPFKGLHRRIDEIKGHHARRFTNLQTVLQSGPQTAFQIMQGLFAHRGSSIIKGSDLFFAMGETLAHIVYEVKRGVIVQSGNLYRLA